MIPKDFHYFEGQKYVFHELAICFGNMTIYWLKLLKRSGFTTENQIIYVVMYQFLRFYPFESC